MTLCALSVGCSDERPYNEVTVIGREYSFQVPDTLPPGPTVFVLQNRGAVRHELGMGLLKKGMTIESAFEADKSGEDPLEAMIGYLIAEPGEKSPGRLLVDLESGRRYGLICTLRDGPDAPKHDELGMRADFTVR